MLYYYTQKALPTIVPVIFGSGFPIAVPLDLGEVPSVHFHYSKCASEVVFELVVL